jgi:hypothetical protein
VAIEKAFSIEGDAEAIWQALWADLGEGEADAFSVEESSWPNKLSLRVEMAGVPCLLTYRITDQDGSCVVSATLEPQGVRYALLQFLTLGRLRRNYEMTLVVGLANLKAAVEDTAEDPDEEG